MFVSYDLPQPKEPQPPSKTVVEEQVDVQLDKDDGLIKRNRDFNL